MNIKVTTDSTCDLSPEVLKRYGIAVAPLYIIKGGRTFRDGVDITPEEIFRHVEQTGEFCTTAAVSTFDYIRFFEPFAAKFDAVLHVSLGSGFSLCHGNARAAAEVFKNVFVVDSKNLSAGQGHVAVEAARLASEGADPAEICRQLADMAERVETSFLIDRLDYLFKGGRCSLATALGANILHLKTCVEISGGKMQVARKYRGAFDSCVWLYVRDRLAGRTDVVPERVFITHPAAPEEAVRAAREALSAYAPYFGEVIETRASCTVSCHCGPRTLGVLFVRKQRERADFTRI